MPNEVGKVKVVFSVKKWPSFKIANFIVISMLIALYYSLGGNYFPDYSNYMTIVEKGGYLFAEDEFIAEWVSRFFLRNGVSLFGSAKNAVDVFAFLIQLFFVFFVFFSGNKISDQFTRGWFFYSMALAPLLLTTALRASPAYLIFAYLGASEIKFSKRVILLGLLAISFHDSAIIMALIYILVFFVSNLVQVIKNPNVLKVLVCMVFPMIIFSSQIIEVIVAILSQFNFGIRAIYLTSLPDPSIVKKVFMLVIWWVCAAAVFSAEINTSVRLFIVTSLFVAALAFAVNEVAGIRLSLYALGSAILAKGAFFSTGTTKDKFRQIDILLAVLYFSFMVFDILRHTENT